MVVCFLCKNNYDSFGAFKAHLTLFHDASEYRTLVCSEENCNRNFQLFNSFRLMRFLNRKKSDSQLNCKVN